MKNTREKIRGVYALCDLTYGGPRDYVILAKALLEGGVSLLQLRMKGEKNLGVIRATAEKILQFKREHDFTFILNDHLDLALELSVDGVHLGKEDLSLAEAQAKSQRRLLIGYSSHSLEEAKRAATQGADYVAIGAIYPTASKGPGHPVVGLEVLRQTVHEIPVPVVAIGGIGRNNFTEVAQTGVAAIAMIQALTEGDPRVNAAHFVSRFAEFS